MYGKKFPHSLNDLSRKNKESEDFADSSGQSQLLLFFMLNPDALYEVEVRDK